MVFSVLHVDHFKKRSVSTKWCGSKAKLSIQTTTCKFVLPMGLSTQALKPDLMDPDP